MPLQAAAIILQVVVAVVFIKEGLEDQVAQAGVVMLVL